MSDPALHIVVGNPCSHARETCTNSELYCNIAYDTEMHTYLEKRKLNQLAPISRLYPEIFSNIFCLVRDSIVRPAPSVWEWRRTKDCIGLTHVCHAWRDIAVNTPTLWTSIIISDEDHLEWVQEMLNRSKLCSLSILVSGPRQSALRPASNSILHGLKNNIHRFRELILLDIPIDDLCNFFSSSHTLQLEYLHIIPYDHTSSDSSDNTSSDNSFETSSDNSSDTSSDTSSDASSDASSDTPSDIPSAARFTLSDNILRVDSLRHLSIEDCGLDFHATFLRSLTYLELLNIDEDCKLPCAEFVAVLIALPGLERLKLEGFLKEGDVKDVEEYVATTNKTLLHIKYLSLSCGMLGEMVQFLCAIILPSSCKLRLRISHGGPETAFQLLTSWLSRHFQPVPSFHSFRTHFRSWGIRDTSYVTSDLRVTGFYDTDLEGSHIGGDIDKALFSASVLLCHDSENEGELIDNVWRSFLNSLPLHNIVSLEVTDGQVPLPDSVWVGVFAPITTLKTIIIDSQFYAGFFHIASPDSSNSIALPFPALSSVTVHAHRIEDYLSIASSLDSRLEVGLAPFNLVFYSDNIAPHVITRLRKSALNVQINSYISSSTII